MYVRVTLSAVHCCTVGFEQQVRSCMWYTLCYAVHFLLLYTDVLLCIYVCMYGHHI